MRSKTTIGGLALGSLVAVLTGCVMPDKVTDMQKNLADIQTDIRQIRAGQEDAKERLTALEQRSTDNPDQVTKADLADVTVGIDQLSRDVSIVDERLNDMGRRLDRLAQQVQQTQAYNYGRTGAPAGGPDEDLGEPVMVTEGETSSGGAVGAVPDPDELYNTAYADFSKGNYALAISGFEEFHEKFPGSPVADNALYWVGECHFSQGDFPEAIRAFDRMLEAYPSSDKAAASNLKKGLAYLEQNQVGQAIIQLRFVVDEYPGSDEAKIARDKLTSLGAPS
jgi:tol-pal system protein YbgF